MKKGDRVAFDVYGYKLTGKIVGEFHGEWLIKSADKRFEHVEFIKKEKDLTLL